MKNNILVIGGTGLVGSRIVQNLRQEIPQLNIWIGSRKAQPQDPKYLKIDVQNPDSLSQIKNRGIDLILLCAADPADNVLRYCVKEGIDYLDITKPTPELQRAYRWAKTQKVASQIVFSSGWMGGIVGSIAYHLTPRFDSLKLFISYSLNDLAGESTTHFIAENVTKPFHKYQQGQAVATKHFLSPEAHNFGFGIGTKNTYDFDIPENFIFHEGEKIPNVTTKMTYNSDLVSKALYLAQKIHLFDWLSHSVRRAVFNASGKGDRVIFEVVVEDKQGLKRKISLKDSEGQAHLTAFSAVMHLKKMLSYTQNGVFFSHQIHEPSSVIQALLAQPQISIKIN